MGLQTFVDKVGPAINSTWLNVVDKLKFTVFADAVTKTAARVALGSDLETTSSGLSSKAIEYTQTAAEAAVGVTPVNYYIPSHDAIGTVIVDRYGTNTTPGTTNMTTAIQNAMKVALTGNNTSGIGDHASITFLRGRYKCNPSVFNNAADFQRGFVIRGQGMESTVLELATGGVTSYFYNNTTANTQQYILVTFEDIKFTADSTTFGYGFNMQQDQSYRFSRCSFYNMAGVLAGNGNSTGSEHKFYACRITFMYNYVIRWNNNQMLNIELHGCDVESIYGDIFQVGSSGGGALRVFGGSYIMDDGGSKHWLLNIDGAGEGSNNDTFTFSGIQTELHSTNTGLVFKGTPSTSCVVAFNDCNQTSTGGARVTVDLSSGYVRFNGGRINGSDTYVMRTTGTITWDRAGNPASIVFDRCGVPSNLSTLITTDSYGYAQAKDCHFDDYEPASGGNVRYAVDFDLNWYNMGRGLGFPGLKTVCFKLSSQDWPSTGDGAANDAIVTLPNNALIKNIYVYRPANGSGGAGNIQISVGNGDKTTTYGSGILQAGTLSQVITIEKTIDALISAGTTNPNNQVRLWGATTNNSIVTDGYAIVQYY